MGYQVNVINNVLSVLVVNICSFPWGHNEFVPQTAHEVLCSQLKCPVSSPNSMFCFVFFPVSKLAWPKRESFENKWEHFVVHQWRHALFPPWLTLPSLVHQTPSEDSGCNKIKAHDRGTWNILSINIMVWFDF